MIQLNSIEAIGVEAPLKYKLTDNCEPGMNHQQSPHILVIDDEPDIHRPLAKYLKQNGFRVSVAGSGARWINFYRSPTSISSFLMS